MNNYYLPQNYIINNNPSHDVIYSSRAQVEVYEYAQKIMERNNLKKIIEIGCGNGAKLMKYLSKYDTIGYETEPCYSSLKKKYPNRKWLESGEKERSFNNKEISECDLIICIDVVEHIIDPNILLDYIKKFNSKYIIISTPCREILKTHKKFVGSTYKRNDIGPPPNDCHVREWTCSEFKDYLSDHFTIIESFLGKIQVECQWHLCSIKK